MKISQKPQQEIKTIIAEMQSKGIVCKKDYNCYKFPPEKLCKTREIGHSNLIECFEEDAKSCGISFSFGENYICKCPLRRYIVQNIQM